MGKKIKKILEGEVEVEDLGGDLPPLSALPSPVEEDLFTGVFREKRVTKHLMFYLGRSVKDMNSLARVSKEFRKIIQRRPEYLNRAMQHINQDVLGGKEVIKFHSRMLPKTKVGVTKMLKVHWRHLAVDLSISELGLQKIIQMNTLSSVESLFLYCSPPTIRRYDLDSSLDSKVSYFMEVLLSNTKKLKRLKLEEGLLFQIQPSMWSSLPVYESLQEVTQLEVHEFQIPITRIRYGNGWKGRGKKFARSRFWTNFQRLSLHPKELRSFVFNTTANNLWHNFNLEWLQIIPSYLDTLKLFEVNMGNLTFDTKVDLHKELSRRFPSSCITHTVDGEWTVVGPVKEPTIHDCFACRAKDNKKSVKL